MKRSFILLVAVVVAVVGDVAFGAAPASASNAPIVITYEKTCDESGHCLGITGDGDTFEMQVTTFRPTGKAGQLTAWITVEDISFTAEMTGHASNQAGFIVLNGTVTDGPFEGAQVHQRSNYVSGPPTASVWTGELRLMPKSG